MLRTLQKQQARGGLRNIQNTKSACSASFVLSRSATQTFSSVGSKVGQALPVRPLNTFRMVNAPRISDHLSQRRGFSTNNDEEAKDPKAAESQVEAVKEEQSEEGQVREEVAASSDVVKDQVTPEATQEDKQVDKKVEKVESVEKAENVEKVDKVENAEQAAKKPKGEKKAQMAKPPQKGGAQKKNAPRARPEAGARGGDGATTHDKFNEYLVEHTYVPESPQGEYARALRVADQKALHQQQLRVGREAAELLQKDIEKMQSKLEEQVMEEKERYVEQLQKQEELMQEDASRRIFCTVSELVEAKALEEQFIDSQIKLKAQSTPSSDKSQSEVEYEMDIRRKEIFVKQANLNAKLNQDELRAAVPRFKSLPEDKQRDVYTSIKIGQAQRRAKVELLRYENDASKHQKMEALEKQAQAHDIMLKKILPKDFKGEHLSPEEIQNRKRNAEQTFGTALEQFKAKSERVKEQQEKMREYQEYMLEYENAKMAAKAVGMDARSLVGYSAFKDKLERINQMKEILKEVNKIENEDVARSEVERDVERSNQKAQVDAEYDAVQERNLLQMVLNMKQDMAQKVKQLQIESAERENAAYSKDGQPDDRIMVDSDQLFKETRPEERRQEVLDLFSKYKVDPVWLKKQQTKKLQEFIEEKNRELQARAEAIEEDLLLGEQASLSKLIQEKASTVELRQHLLRRLKSSAFGSHVSGAQSSQEQYLNEAIIAELESSLTRETENGEATPPFNLTQFLMNKLAQQDVESGRPLRPANSVFDQKRHSWRAQNPYDQTEQQEVFTYEEYRLRQIHKMKKTQAELEEMQLQEGAYPYHGHPEDGEATMFSRMTLAKRRAWYKIYNDYLQNQRNKEMKVDNREMRGANNNARISRTAPGELPNKAELDKVKTERDFYELFRNWRLTAQEDSLIAGGGFKQLSARELGGVDFLDVHGAQVEEAGKTASGALRGRVRRGELFFAHENEPLLKTSPTTDIKRWLSKEMHDAIKAREQALDQKKDALLQETGAKNMYDKDAMEKAEIEQYDADLRELIAEKENFKEEFGMAFHEFNPIEVSPVEVGPESRHKVEIQYPLQAQEQKLDRSFVNSKRREAYKNQYPEDKVIDVIKLEQIELDPQTQVEVDEWLYNQRLQEKYERFFMKQKALVESGRRGQQLHQDQPQVTARADGVEMDDDVVRRILLHLNENSERDYLVSQEYEDDGRFEEQLATQKFDVEGFEKSKKEGYLAWLGDYARQQQLVFELQAKQTKIDEALKSREEAVDSMHKNKKREEKEKMKHLDMAGWKQREEEMMAQMESQKAVLQRAIQAAAGGDAATRKNLEKSLRRGTTTGGAAQTNDASFLASQIQAQQKLLQEMKSSEADPISMLSKSIQEERAALGALREDPLLKEYVLFDKFGAHRAVVDMASQPEAAKDSEEALQESIRTGVVLAEDLILQRMASEYREFDMDELTSSLHIPEVAYLGTNKLQNEKLQDFAQAKASDEVIQAAGAQALTPQQQRLSLLYDPRNSVREAYLRTKYQMFVNKQVRQELADRILKVKAALKSTKEDQHVFYVEAQDLVRKYSSDVVPKKVHDFLGGSQQESSPASIGVANIMERLKKFDPASKDIQNYNDELHLQNQLLKEANAKNTEEEAIPKQQEFILQQMEKNGVQPDAVTHALLFEKNVLSNHISQANQNLRNLLQSGGAAAPFCQIPLDSLQQFFDCSLSQDNFDGLAFLINFVEQKDVDISGWDMSRFRSGLDFYLNHAFNISKILTFTRFYAHHVVCSLRSPSLQDSLEKLDALSEQDLALLHTQVFGKVEDLVDMHALFGHLVERVDRKTLIDPISKVDPIINLVDLFARSDVKKLCKHSEQGTTFLNENDVVQYLVNHLDQPGTFKNLQNYVMKFDDNSFFATALIKALKEIQVKKGRLPESLNQENVKRFYLQIKGIMASQSGQEHNEQLKISEKTAELFLYLFKINSMVAESVDLCQNFGRMVRGSGEAAVEKSEIRNYYMSDALLQVPLDAKKDGGGQHYYSLLERAVFEDKDSADSAAYLLSMTKAYLKDGNVDHALKFFEEGIQSRREIRQDQDDMLVSMFDSSFGLDKQSDRETFSLQTFAARFYHLMSARQKLKREARLVQILDSILERCDSNEIEHIFSLQAVLRQERQILRGLAGISPNDYAYLYQAYEGVGVDEDKIKAFVAEHYRAVEQVAEDRTEQVLADLQIDALDAKMKKAGLEGKLADALLTKTGRYATGAREGSGRDDLAVVEVEKYDEEAERQEKMDRIAGELYNARVRRHALESKIEHDNVQKLVELMTEAEDGQFELLDQVVDLDTALKTLGLSKDSYASYQEYEEGKPAIEKVLEALKLESGAGANERAEEVNRGVMEAFKASVAECTDAQLKALAERRRPYAMPGHSTLPEKFQAKYDLRNVELVLADAEMEGWPDDSRDQAQEDQETLRLYQQFLHDDRLDDHSDEEEALRRQAHVENAEFYEEELKAALQSRKDATLPFAIKTFNKIQQKQLPLWLRPEGELNAERSPAAQAQPDLVNMGYANYKVDFKEGATSAPVNRSYRGKGFDKGPGGGYREGGLGDRDQARDRQAVADEQRAQDAALYQLTNSRVTDPKLINETIQKYEYLLTDPTSPILSNFVALLDYEDGRDLMGIEEFHEKYSAISSSSPLVDQRRHPLRAYLRQTEKMQTLCEELDRMLAVAVDMDVHIHQQRRDLVAELQGAEKYKHWYSQKKDDGLKKIINDNIIELYNKFLDEHKYKPKIELEGDSGAAVDLTQYLDDDAAMGDDASKPSDFLPRRFTRDEKIAAMKQAVSLEMGGYKLMDVFNTFYAEDLVVFGLENNVPVAVRLGEKMFSENDQAIPQVLAGAIKNYKLYHASSYQEAMKRTGPIDTEKAYRSGRLQAGAGDTFSRSTVVSAGDPYWRSFYERNFRAQDHHKLPSALAWEHKPDGILGEVLDLKKLRRNAAEASKML